MSKQLIAKVYWYETNEHPEEAVLVWEKGVTPTMKLDVFSDLFKSYYDEFESAIKQLRGEK